MFDGWNFADIFEALADRFPDAPAQVQGARRYSWAQFDRRADGIAGTLVGHGIARNDKVAQYLYNSPEYLESLDYPRLTRLAQERLGLA